MGFEKLNDTADVGIIQADFSSGELVAVGYASAVPGKHWFYGTSTAGPNGTSWSGTTPLIGWILKGDPPPLLLLIDMPGFRFRTVINLGAATITLETAWNAHWLDAWREFQSLLETIGG